MIEIETVPFEQVFKENTDVNGNEIDWAEFFGGKIPETIGIVHLPPAPENEVERCRTLGLPRIKGDITPVKFMKCPVQYALNDGNTLIYPLR